MTLPYHIIIGRNLNSSEQEKVLNIIQSTFDEVNTYYNSFNPLSEVSKINQMKRQEPIKLSYELAKLLKLCDQYVALTQKHFDPTVGSIFTLWKQYFEENKDLSLLNFENYETAIGWNLIHIQQGLLTKAHSNTQLDLNAIAKGYAVDLLIERIQSIGYKNLFVEWGGDVKALGKHPLKKAWKIQVLFPDCHRQTLLYNQACATSGSFMLSKWEKEENNSKKTYFHVIDPLSKKPMKIRPSNFSYAAVIAPNCAQADALATAALTFPTCEKAERWARQIVKKNPSISFWFYQSQDQPNIMEIKSETISFF